MKKQEIQELRNRPVADLQKLQQEKSKHLRSLRFDLAAGKVKNINEIREVKKDIARIMTFINKQNKK